MYTSFAIILVRYGKRLKYPEAHSLMEGYYWIKVVSVLLKMLHRGIVCLCVCMRESGGGGSGRGGSIGIEETGEGKARPYLIVEFHASSVTHCLGRLVC